MLIDSIIDNRDGEIYSTVRINNQVWISENLRFNAIGSWLNVNNPNSEYGRLYSWRTAMDSANSSLTNPSGVRGICPLGWHVPSESEWNELEISLGMDSTKAYLNNNPFTSRGSHGLVMKSQIGWNGTNTSKFNVLPAGRYVSGTFDDLGGFGIFWTSSQSSSGSAWNRTFSGANDGVWRNSWGKSLGFSCRCVQD